MFLFLLNFKRIKRFLDFIIIFCLLTFLSNISAKCTDNSCGDNGVCKDDTCDCYDGWQGPQCQFCGGKMRLTNSEGVIFDGPGNYSLSTKCSWLIDAPNSTITFHIEEFITECGWDHLYVFDGDSVNSPLLAVFSGLIYNDSYSIRRIPEVTATSGAALIHFSSDDVNTMSGFNITYRLNSCPSKTSGTNCSSHGICLDGVCKCDSGWYGAACHLEVCPNNCGASENHGICQPVLGCSCVGNYKGDDCSQVVSEGYWETVQVNGFPPAGSASHGAVVWRDSMYITAGENFNRESLMYAYDFKGNVWETPHIAESPVPRYGHSTVLYEDKIFLYGGVLGNRDPTSELWAFDINTKTWENITVKVDACNNNDRLDGRLRSAGHSATVIRDHINYNRSADRMVVIFGHSPYLGYLNTVQEYYFGTSEWRIVSTEGYPVKGSYGHTASWDLLTNKIYIYGGIVSESDSVAILSQKLYSYDADSHVWTLLTDAPSTRFLHTATFVTKGLMLVLGGNTNIDISRSLETKCYSSDVLAYDVLCDNWTVLPIPKSINTDLARFGHSAVVFEDSLFIYGGFDSQMLSDMLKYTPGDCSFSNETFCLNSKSGVKCVWNSRSNVCSPVFEVAKDLTLKKNSYIKKCISRKKNKITCEQSKDCLSCSYTAGCKWCDSICMPSTKCRKTLNNSTNVILNLTCSIDPIPTCRQLHTCNACTSQPLCQWSSKNSKCIPHPHNINESTEIETIRCPAVCSEYSSCLNCTQEDCVWCQNEERCVEGNALISSFPYGGCREWTTYQAKCRVTKNNENSQCGFYKTCTKCREDPACGWCDDGSNTGVGTCMSGGNGGPAERLEFLLPSTCPSERWHFTTCPICQCNGHSNCKGDTSTCLSCSNLTAGGQCEFCQKGFWGNPENGGKCTPCNCKKQSDNCHRETGKCYCSTKGTKGDQCEKCDHLNRYNEDSIDRLCYYDLTTNYQFTFNLSRADERNYTEINFKNSPLQADRDVYLKITCSNPAKMNITVRENNSPEKEIYTMINRRTNETLILRFSKSEYHFGNEDKTNLTTFLLHVYDFQPPLWIEVFFSQYLELPQKLLEISQTVQAELDNKSRPVQ